MSRAYYIEEFILMDRRVVIYLVGIVIGCVLLTILPKPFNVNRDEMRADAARATGNYPIDYVDSYGRSVQIPYPPQKIVSLAPSITETLFYLGLDEQLVANTLFCKYPARAQNKLHIGGIDNPDLEQILAIRPDIVIGTTLTPQEVYEQLERIGITAVAMNQGNWNSVVAEMRSICRFMNRSDLIHDHIGRIIEQRRAVETRVKERQDLGMPTPKVLIIYDWEELYSAGVGTWSDDLVSMSGGVNVVDNSMSSWPKLSKEYIIRSNPDVIILRQPEDSEEKDVQDALIARTRSRLPWSRVNAIQQNRILYMDEDMLTIPGPRMALALDTMEKFIAMTFRPDKTDKRQNEEQ